MCFRDSPRTAFSCCNSSGRFSSEREPSSCRLNCYLIFSIVFVWNHYSFNSAPNLLAVVVLAAVVTAAVIAVVLAAVAAAVLIAVLAVILVVVLAAVVAVVAVLAVIHIVVIVFHGSYLLIGRFICYRSSMAAWKKNIHTTWKNWNIFKIIISIWFLSPFLV